MQKFPWFFSALWLTILVVMLWAGFWQLRRADEKSEIETRLAEGLLLQPHVESDWQSMQAFDRIQVTGQYGDTHFLLDNQIMNGQIGFFVFTTFKTSDGFWLLVNRGWHNNDQVDFKVTDGVVAVVALVADWPRPGFKLGEQSIANQGVQHVTYLDRKLTAAVLKQRLCKQKDADDCIILPQVLKLVPQMEHGFKRDWQLPKMTVAKHNAYAAQWFTMSVVLCFIYAVFLKKQYTAKKDAS